MKVERNGIEHGIGAVPLGGYVRIPGMHRPAAGDFHARTSAAVGEDRRLGGPADAVERDLDAAEYDAARAALPQLTAALDQAQLSPRARLGRTGSARRR